jgi:hypothetical protein
MTPSKQPPVSPGMTLSNPSPSSMPPDSSPSGSGFVSVWTPTDLDREHRTDDEVAIMEMLANTDKHGLLLDVLTWAMGSLQQNPTQTIREALYDAQFEYDI